MGYCYERNHKENGIKLEESSEKILFKSYNAQSQTMFKELNILSFYKQKIFGILQVMWILYNNNIPENISGFFQLKQTIYGANNLKYLVSNLNLDNTKNSLLFQGPVPWKKLPADQKYSKTILLFKTMLKSYLLDVNSLVARHHFETLFCFYLLQFVLQNCFHRNTFCLA